MFPFVGSNYPIVYLGPTERFNINHYILPIFNVTWGGQFLGHKIRSILPRFCRFHSRKMPT